MTRRVGIVEHSSKLHMLAAIQAMTMGLGPVYIPPPDNGYQPEEDCLTDEQVQTLVHTAEAKRQRKNAKRLKDMTP